MATRNRQRFLRWAVAGFVRQTYANKELLVIDDGDRSAEKLCRGVQGVRYLRVKPGTRTGTKLNLGIEAARGDILHKLDDDDIYASSFLASSVAHLPRRGRTTNLVARCCFLVLLHGDPSLRQTGHGWKAGGTFCFWRDMWKRHCFRDIPRSVDSWFLRDNRPNLLRLCRPEEYVLVRHGANTWNRIPGGHIDDYFKGLPSAATQLHDLVPAEALRFYRTLTGAG
jgi:glycosyltransferase involved in cell wall biosynthesis